MIKALIVISLSVIAAGCATPKQALYDAEVDRLCEKDGGLRVNRRIAIEAEKFDSNGRLILLPGHSWQDFVGPEFKYTYEARLLKGVPAESATIWRYSQRLVRLSNGELIGEAVLYTRGGGDFLGGFAGSTYTCGAREDLLNKVFFKEFK